MQTEISFVVALLSFHSARVSVNPLLLVVSCGTEADVVRYLHFVLGQVINVLSCVSVICVMLCDVSCCIMWCGVCVYVLGASDNLYVSITVRFKPTPDRAQALSCLFNCHPSGNEFDNSALQLSFSKNFN